MVRAEAKKNENISEYIIHMFKTEDLLRTFEFDLNRVTNQVILNIPTSDNEKKELILWYAKHIESMQTQEIIKSGHLKEVNELIEQLLKLHDELIITEPDYKAIISKAAPFISSQIQESNNTLNNPIIVCLNAIYGLLILKLEGKEVSPAQQDMLESFGDLLSYLSYKYKELYH